MDLDLLLALPVLLLSVVAHEVAHAEAARRQGDMTARDLGRITLNPIKHVDPFMTVILPLVLWFGSGGQFVFGAAKPVPVNPGNYRDLKRGDIIVSSAGIVVNLGLVVLAGLAFVAAGLVGSVVSPLANPLAWIQRAMYWGMWLNLVLAFFNVLPIPPLDGSHVLAQLLPPTWAVWYRKLHRFGFLPFILILVFFRPMLTVLLWPAFFVMRIAHTTISGFALSGAIPT